MKSLVTGGNGFIGSFLVDKLINIHKNEVIVIDNKSSNNENNNFVKGAKYYDLDLKDFDKILPIFKGVDRVFHMASDVSIDFCNKNPRLAGINNSNITLNTLECCRLNKIKKYVFSSTSAVYKSKDQNITYNEIDETHPLNLYSASKLFGENLCKIYHDLYGLETTILRYFNVYGPNMKFSPYSSVIVKFLNSKQQNKPLSIHGDGKQTRDFVYVEDVINANILASETNLNEYGKIYNIGSGNSITIKELSKLISKKHVFLSERKGDIKYSCADIKRAKKELKWTPNTNLKKWFKLLN